MTKQQAEELDTRPLVEWLAGRIANPVLRLRFLQAVMPPLADPDPPRRHCKSWSLILFLVVALLFSAPLRRPQTGAAGGVPRPPVAAARPRQATSQTETPEVWQVEKTDAFETYSNGLRIEGQFSVASRRRSYLVFSATRPEDIVGEHRSVPAGIVFHTTESLQAPFESGQNSALQNISKSLLNYVRFKQAYNFLIDRFGRVYRVVQESDVANHAGDSVWSDPEWLYLNLNQSFLGVSFETQTLPEQAQAAVNPAQFRAAAMLTEMLRKRYGIPAGNCITHAQVSVNISNLLIGYHIDWASSFPFEQLGLPDNYALPLPAVSVFGFEYDSSFVGQAGVRLYQGVQFAEQVLRDRAAAAHLPVPAYRKALQTRYWSQLAAVRRDAGGMKKGR